MTLDEAVTHNCEHGMPKLIACPKCNPDAYILTDEQLARVHVMIEELEKYLPL